MAEDGEKGQRLFRESLWSSPSSFVRKRDCPSHSPSVVEPLLWTVRKRRENPMVAQETRNGSGTRCRPVVQLYGLKLDPPKARAERTRLEVLITAAFIRTRQVVWYGPCKVRTNGDLEGNSFFYCSIEDDDIESILSLFLRISMKALS